MHIKGARVPDAQLRLGEPRVVNKLELGRTGASATRFPLLKSSFQLHPLIGFFLRKKRATGHVDRAGSHHRPSAGTRNVSGCRSWPIVHTGESPIVNAGHTDHDDTIMMGIPEPWYDVG